MSIQIGKAIYSILSADAELSALVGNRIFPLIAVKAHDEETIYPFIVFRRDSINPSYSKDGINSDITTVSILCVSNDYEQSALVADLALSALSGKRGTFEGEIIDSIRLIEASEDFQEDAFVQSIKITINTNRL